MMNERIYSDRMNRFINVDRQKAKELRDEYLAEYEREIMAVIDGTALTMDCCIECDAPVTYRESHP